VTNTIIVERNTTDSGAPLAPMAVLKKYPAPTEELNAMTIPIRRSVEQLTVMSRSMSSPQSDMRAIREGMQYMTQTGFAASTCVPELMITSKTESTDAIQAELTRAQEEARKWRNAARELYDIAAADTTRE